ncbi:MAG: hypothetical protein MUC58_12345 [Rhizobiaceae bacterium]|jgi:hypothetical protein|nr:hypothetical protein [Rhizobiaceae bacterium]
MPVTFKQADLKRAIRGVQAAGITPSRVEIRPSGEIVIITGADQAAPDNALDQWLANRNARPD